MSTDTTARISFFDLAASAIARSLATANRLAVDLSDVERWPTLATREDVLERAVAEARLRSQPVALALDAAIRELPILDRVSTAAAGARRDAARAALEQAAQLAAKGGEAAARDAYERARRELERAVADADRVLVPVEAQTGREILAEALRDLGYDDLRVSRAGDLRGRRSADGKLVYAHVDDRGALEVALAGHDGLTCQPHTEEILEALRRRGAGVRDRRTDVHGCRSGGPLARGAQERAAACAEPTPAPRRRGGRTRDRARPGFVRARQRVSRED